MCELQQPLLPKPKLPRCESGRDPAQSFLVPVLNSTNSSALDADVLQAPEGKDSQICTTSQNLQKSDSNESKESNFHKLVTASEEHNYYIPSGMGARTGHEFINPWEAMELERSTTVGTDVTKRSA